MSTAKSNKVNVEDAPVSPIEEVATARAASIPGTSYPSMAAVVVQDQSSSSSAKDLRPGSVTVTVTSANSASDFCVSEHEDEVSDVVNVNVNVNAPVPVNMQRRISSESGSSGNSRIIVNDEDNNDSNREGQRATTSTSSATTSTGDNSNSGPAEIPPETDGQDQVDPGEDDDDDDDDESDYSYDYDEEDDGHFAGFLAYDGGHGAAGHGAAVVPQEHSDAPIETDTNMDGKKNIVEDEETTSAHASTSANNNKNNKLNNDSSAESGSGGMQFASLETTSAAVGSKTKWKEPTRAAVSMSLRAEREKSGGRRRLAADLYKVMMTDTQEAGFAVEQNDDECMDEWTVRLFKFDEDSDLHKDLLVLGLDHVELKMNFPEQYPFEPPFVRVVRPRFKRQTGFVMNGALCMELLTNEGWNPINDIESVIVSIRSLLVVGDGRVEAAADMTEKKREALLAAAANGGGKLSVSVSKQQEVGMGGKRKRDEGKNGNGKKPTTTGSYSTAEAKAAYSHLSSYHKKKGWSGWWAKRG